MSDLICRTLRDGALEGEHAPALTLKDSVNSPFGFDAFTYVLSQQCTNILTGKSQAKGLVLVAFSRSPSFYVNLLKERGCDVKSSSKCFRILDCYSDPLGWKDRILRSGRVKNAVEETSGIATLCKDVKDMVKLSSMVTELGKDMVEQGKDRFSVAIDSVDEMLRHGSKLSVAQLVSNLRSHDQVSSIFWLLHADLWDNRVIAAFEYMSSMVACLEPIIQISETGRLSSENFPVVEQNLRKGKFLARFKRRNGRVRMMREEFSIEDSGINFTPISSDDQITIGGLMPKVQFNLQLSEKEQSDRAKVVLPFEHQGNGKPIEIYDGRRPPVVDKKNELFVSAETEKAADSSKGEIIYLRDSDDEMPDSDEDPDDDLDI